MQRGSWNLKREEVKVIDAALNNPLVSDQPVLEPLVPFALRYLEPGSGVADDRAKTATSIETRQDGEEEADTDWQEGT